MSVIRVLIFCLFAFTAFAAEPPIDYVASLCKPGKKCCFLSTATMSVTQSSSVSAAQPQKFDTQFCVTTNANDAGQLKAVFSKAREARRADDISVDSPTGIDLVESIVQDVERANIRNNIAQASVFFTLDTDGSLKSFSCSAEAHEGAECEIQMAVLKAALRKVKINAPQETSLLSARTGKSTHFGVHAELGKYKLQHSQAIRDGKVHLLSTTTFEGSTLKHKTKAGGDEIAGSSGETESDASITASYVVKDEAVLRKDGQVESFSATDQTSIASSMKGAPSDTSSPAVAAFLQTGARLSAEPEEFQESAGETQVSMTYDLMLYDETDDDKKETFEVTAAFIQVPDRIHFGPGKADARLDMDYSKVLSLFTTHASLMPVAFALERAPGATVTLDAKVSSWYQAKEITEMQYARYLSMLASVNTAAAEALFVTKLTDSKLQRENTLAVEQAMSSLLSRTVVPEGIYRTLLEIAETSEVESVRDTALLVLSGLLDNHSHLEGSSAMPAWCQQMFDRIMSTVDSAKFRSEVNAAALGNTRWLATQPKLAEYLSHPDLFTVHVAVDGLRHHASKLSDETEEKLVGVLTGHDWTNVSSQIPSKVIGLLEHSAKLKNKVSWPADNAYGVKLTIFSMTKAIPKDSDYHKSNVNVAVSISRKEGAAADGGGDISFTAGAALEAELFKIKFSYDGGNAITDITFEAKRAAATGKWAKGVAFKILGKAIKVWGEAQTDAQEATWTQQVLKTGLSSIQGWKAGDDSKEKEHGICKGRFDFTKAAASGVGANSVAIDIFMTQTFAQGSWTFYIGFGFSAVVGFKVDGTAGVMPAVGWASGSNVGASTIEAERLGGNLDDCAPGGTTWVAGVKPYGKLELTLSVLIEFLGFTKAGIEAKIVLVSIGFPAYGRLIPATGGPSPCGSLELEAAAFSGVIKAVFYIRKSEWYCLGLPCGSYPGSPNYDFSVFTWTGLEYVSQLSKSGNSYCDWNYGSGWVPTPAPTHVHHRHHSHHRHHNHHRHFWGRRRLLDAEKSKQDS